MPPQSIRRWLALWLLSVLLLWTLAHALNRWVLLMDERSEAARFVWWTGAKLVAWLLPTLCLLHRCGCVSARWLGLTTGRGLGVAVLWSVLWIGMQETGVRLQLPLFSRPPTELTWAGMANSLLVAPFLEELLFRGAMLRLLRQAGHGPTLSIVTAAVGFALLHVPGWLFRLGLDPAIAVSFFTIGAFGAVAGALAWRVPSLWAPMLLHLANNAWSTGVLPH